MHGFQTLPPSPPPFLPSLQFSAQFSSKRENVLALQETDVQPAIFENSSALSTEL